MAYLNWLGINMKETYDIVKKISKKVFMKHPEQMEALKNQCRPQWLSKVGSMEGFEETWKVMNDAGSYASATTYISGQAVNLTAHKLRDKILELAAKILRSHELILADNKVKSPTAEISLLEIAQQAETLEAELEYAADKCSMTFAVQGVEVEVDTETGHIKVLRSIQAIDIGKAINPRICEGQATGGMVMGLGYALSEELRIDEQGKILNPRLRTYQLPTALDVPPMQVFLVEKADPYGPFGAKGIGEICTNCTAPAIANAVAHATGIRLTQLPMTPERVWQHLEHQSSHPNCG